MATFAHQPGQPQRRRIALLHGTAGSAKTLTIQLGPLLPKLQETWDVTFAEGPKLCAEDNPHVKTMRRFYGPSAELREYAEATADDRGWRTYNGSGGRRRRAGDSKAGRTVCSASAKARTSRRCSQARAEQRGAPFRAVVLLCARVGLGAPAAWRVHAAAAKNAGPNRRWQGRTPSSVTATIWQLCSHDRSARRRRGPPHAARAGRGLLRDSVARFWIGTGARTAVGTAL